MNPESDQEAKPLSGNGSCSASQSQEAKPELVIEEVVCDTCIKDNLLKSIGIQKCYRCSKPFCLHYSAKADPHYCVNCLGELKLTTEVVTKSYEHEHYDALEDKVITTTYSRNAKRYTMSGDDWLFVQRRSRSMSDEELDMFIEYHRQYRDLLLAEKDTRRAERLAALRAKSEAARAPSGAVSTTRSTTTVVKKTTTVKTNKKLEQLKAQLAVMVGTDGVEEALAKLIEQGLKI